VEEQYPRKTCANYRMHCAEKGAWKLSFLTKALNNGCRQFGMELLWLLLTDKLKVLLI